MSDPDKGTADEATPGERDEPEKKLNAQALLEQAEFHSDPGFFTLEVPHGWYD